MHHIINFADTLYAYIFQVIPTDKLVYARISSPHRNAKHIKSLLLCTEAFLPVKKQNLSE